MAIPGAKKVRLSDAERLGILQALEHSAKIHKIRWSEIALFGSRIDPNRKGGDIDLYLKVDANPKVDTFQFKRDLKIALSDRLGEQKFDLIIDDGLIDLGSFGNLVKEEKVTLWTQS